MLRYYSIFSFLILFSTGLNAQQRTVRGTVKSEGGEKLVAAMITLVNQKGTVLKYAGTDDKGGFLLNMPVSGEELWLEVSYFGYLKERQQATADRNIYDFVLKTDPIGLKEVVVKAAPVLRQGDTLSYHVESFATGQDRSIGDVLRRMPGIEIEADGTIYHNGEKIQNLYIHGDNLMEGRYGLATKAIHRDMIVRVDIIQNHQPVNVLRGKVRSDKTSLNLVLKDENSVKLTGKMMLGGGTPGQVDASVSPILLNKTVKMVNLAGLNNAGVDYRGNFRKLGAAGLTEEMKTEFAQVPLSQGTAGAPDLPLKNYYFNRSGLLTLNNSFTNRRDMQFRVNLNGFTDNNSRVYDAMQENYLEKDTVVYREHQSLTNRSRALRGSLNIEANKRKYFLNNRLELSVENDRDASALDFNAQSFHQKLGKKLYSFSNDIHWIPALKNKGVGEIRWFINKTNDAQTLSMGQGIPPGFTGDETRVLESALQKVRIPSLSSQGYLSYKVAGTILTQDYKVGHTYEVQHLDTRLSYREAGQKVVLPVDAQNDLRWKREALLLSSAYQLKYEKFYARLDLPLTLQRITYHEQAYDLDEERFDPLFTPRASLQYEFSAERKLGLKYSFNRLLGNMSHVYRGAVLQNYRALQANNADLQEKAVHSAGITYDYQKSANMFFANIGGFYNHHSANTLVSMILEDNIQKMVLLDQHNRVTSTGLNAGMSKYIFGLKATVGLKGSWSASSFEQIINGMRMPFSGNSRVLRGSFNKRFFERINLLWEPAYNGFSSGGKTKAQPSFTHNSYRISQDINLGIELPGNLLWEITAKHSYSGQSGSGAVKYFFLDSKARYTHRKKKLDVSLEAVNLFNIRNYTLYSLYSNQLMVNSYELRGRMLTLRADYYF